MKKEKDIKKETKYYY